MNVSKGHFMRLTTIAASAAVLALTAGGAVVAVADPGPHHGNNTYGLCTAYFAGSDQGRAKKRQAGPFQALESAAGVDGDDEQDEIDQKVRDWCTANGGSGNPGNGKAPGKP